MLIGGNRLVILDCEVAWYGDPAFDVAFLLNHFLLKSLHLYPNSEPFLDLIAVFRNQYRDTLGHRFEEIGPEQRISHLLSMLFLARIDGKSPVEYITDNGKKDLVRRFATRVIPQTPDTISDLVNDWRTVLFSKTPLMEET
jgi:thiamine kinase-like enzyme